MFLIFRMKNNLKEYLIDLDKNEKMKFKSIVEAKQYLAEHMKLTDYDIFIQNINFEEIGCDNNDDR